MSPAPAPLVPSGVDLRSYDWFPFFHKRLRQSSFWKRASDLACRISVDLWSEAYEQIPAASLPDDDYLLAEWAGFGRRDVRGWLSVKDEVMSAWKLCSDGRWYHPTLSEVACEAWVKQRVHVWARECDRLRKENARRARDGLSPLDIPPKPSDDPFEATPSSIHSHGNEEHSTGHPEDVRETSSGRPAEASDFPVENALRVETGRSIESFSLRSKDEHAGSSAEQHSGEPKPARPPLRKHPPIRQMLSNAGTNSGRTRSAEGRPRRHSSEFANPTRSRSKRSWPEEIVTGGPSPNGRLGATQQLG